MRLFLIFLLVAVTVGQDVTDPQVAAVETVDTPQQNEMNAAVATDVIATAPARSDLPVAATVEQTAAPQTANTPATPQYVLPYPLYRRVFPPIESAFLSAREAPPMIQYIPVVVQQPTAAESEVPALARDISANFGGHIGPLGGGFTTGLGPSGFGAGAGFGWGRPYTYYGQNINTYPSQTYRPSSYYTTYSREIPQNNQEQFNAQPQQPYLIPLHVF
jgi:hypothetical protein